MILEGRKERTGMKRRDGNETKGGDGQVSGVPSFQALLSDRLPSFLPPLTFSSKPCEPPSSLLPSEKRIDSEYVKEKDV